MFGCPIHSVLPSFSGCCPPVHLCPWPSKTHAAQLQFPAPPWLPIQGSPGMGVGVLISWPHSLMAGRSGLPPHSALLAQHLLCFWLGRPLQRLKMCAGNVPRLQFPRPVSPELKLPETRKEGRTNRVSFHHSSLFIAQFSVRCGADTCRRVFPSLMPLHCLVTGATAHTQSSTFPNLTFVSGRGAAFLIAPGVPTPLCPVIQPDCFPITKEDVQQYSICESTSRLAHL